MKIFWLLAGLLLHLAAVPRPGAAETIVIAGTGDSQELLRVLAATYAAGHPGARIEVPDSIGSSGGIKAVAKGACALARIARPLKENETALGLTVRVFAISPVVVAVNPNIRKVRNLNAAQLVGIYSGTITDWGQLGGEPGKIFVANREVGDSSRNALAQYVAGFGKITHPAGRILYSTQEMIEVLTRHPNTIGYAPLAMVRQANLRVLKLDGVTPTPENVRSGIYPLASTFALVWKGALSGLAKDFVGYLESAEARRIIASQGATPLKGRDN